MNKSIYLIAASIIAMLIIALWLSSRPWLTSPVAHSVEPSGGPNPANHTDRLLATQKEETNEEKERKHAEFMNIPLVFYGRVVNQDSEDLPGVVVSIRTTRSTNLLEHFSGTDPYTNVSVVTDNRGLFLWQGNRGTYLAITSLKKEGYRQPFQNTGFSYDRRFPECHQPDPSKPVVFILIRNDIPKAIKVYDQQLKLAWNTVPVTLDLGPKIGYLVLSPTRRRDDGHQVRGYDWSVDIQSNGFVIAPFRAEDLPVAPTDGYSAKYHYGALRADKPWVGSIRKLYVVRTQGDLYGKLELSVDSDSDDNGVTGNVTVYLNEAGTKNIDHN